MLDMKRIVVLFALLYSVLGFSQFNELAPWNNNTNSGGENAKPFGGEKTINELIASFDSYWSTHDKSKKGSGYKPFMRWVDYWQNNTDANGYLITPQQTWAAWNQKRESKTDLKRGLPSSNWVPVGPFSFVNTGSWSSGQGRVNEICVDPSNSNIIYVGAPAGGIWKSTDAGLNWIPLADQLPQIGVSGIAVDYSDSNTIYIATGDRFANSTYSVGVLKSTDGGFNWNTTGLTFTNTITTAGDLVIHPQNNQILWCATSVGLFKTVNAGASWVLKQSGNFSKGSLRLQPGNPSTIYAVTNNKFYKSTDSGESFTDLTSSAGLPATSGRLVLDVTPANANYVYILSANANADYTFQGIYKSVNGGVNFAKTATTTDIFEINQAWYDLALAVSSTNAEEIYTGCFNIWKSTNGGTSVTKLNSWSAPQSASYTHGDIHFLRFFGNKFYAGTDGGIYISSNGGTNFNSLTEGLQIGQFYKIAVSKQSSDKIMGGLQDNGGYAYSNNLWKNFFGGDGMDSAIDPKNSDKYYGFTQYGGSLHSSNSAGNSSSLWVAAPANETGNWVTPLGMDTAGTLFSGFSKLYKLNGSAWVQQSTTSVGSGNIELITIDPNNANTIFISNGNELYKSTDQGVTFALVYTASSLITSIAVHYSNSNLVYLTTAEITGQVLKSNDGGTTFLAFSEGLPFIGKNVIKHQGRHSLNPLYIGTSLGVYFRDDSMSQWEPFDNNLPNVSVTDLEINLEDSKITAATYGRGIWQSAIPIEIPPVDLRFEGVSFAENFINCGTFNPTISVKNNGATTINEITVDYKYNGTPLQYVWNGVSIAGAITAINLPSITTPVGIYTLNASATTPNDAYADNNEGDAPLYVNTDGALGVVNTFESAATALLTYTDGLTSSQWQRGIRVGSALATGTNNVYTTNFTGNYPNSTKAYLISGCYNLTQISNPVIRFKMAFDIEQDWDVVYVEYSTNSGQTWSVLGSQGANWYNSSRTLQTAGDDCYNCVGAQWTGTNTVLKEYSYPLNALAGNSEVIFRIVFHSDEATRQLGVVVDDFVIDGTLSNATFALDQVAIYPNPSKGIFNLSLGTIIPDNITVYDVMGKVIYATKDLSVSNNGITTLDLASAATGIYFVKIASAKQSVTKRIVKE
jgi:hypothetical protein